MPDHKPLRCDCGYEISDDIEHELVEEIRRHARDAHGIAFSVEEALLILLRSQLDVAWDSSTGGTRGSAVSSNEGGER